MMFPAGAARGAPRFLQIFSGFGHRERLSADTPLNHVFPGCRYFSQPIWCERRMTAGILPIGRQARFWRGSRIDALLRPVEGLVQTPEEVTRMPSSAMKHITIGLLFLGIGAFAQTATPRVASAADRKSVV